MEQLWVDGFVYSITYLNMTSDRGHACAVASTCDGDNGRQTTNYIQEWFKEHDKEPKALAGPPNSPNPYSIERSLDMKEP